MENQENSLSRRLAERRQALDITQSALAQAVGVVPHAVTQWESGAREPRGMAMLVKVATALDCSVHWLCTGEER